MPNANSYESPTQSTVSAETISAHPARSFLLLNAAIYFLWSLGAIATGLFVGPQILLPGLAVFASAISAILLARVRRYSPLVRNATLLWFGLVAAALITLGVANLRDAADYVGAAFSIGALLLVLPIPFFTCRKPQSNAAA